MEEGREGTRSAWGLRLCARPRSFAEAERAGGECARPCAAYSISMYMGPRPLACLLCCSMRVMCSTRMRCSTYSRRLHGHMRFFQKLQHTSHKTESSFGCSAFRRPTAMTRGPEPVCPTHFLNFDGYRFRGRARGMKLKTRIRYTCRTRVFFNVTAYTQYKRDASQALFTRAFYSCKPKSQIANVLRSAC